MKKFWMLYVEGATAPRVQHWSKAKAEAEAERLARTVPDSRVFLLEATAVARVEPRPVEWDDELEAVGDPLDEPQELRYPGDPDF